MSTVAEIEAAIKALLPAERARLAVAFTIQSARTRPRLGMATHHRRRASASGALGVGR